MALSISNKQLIEFVDQYPRLLVITGAGCSAASGIPTYRDDNGSWQRNSPIQHEDFIKLESSRKRYWARSLAGWPAIYNARPNASHRALATLEAQGYCQLLVTQNVDRLHQKAGHKNIIDLHGRLDRVICLNCKLALDRQVMQQNLLQINAHLAFSTTQLAPDGDAEVEEFLTEKITIPACPSCQGILKPDVVFYGGAVEKSVVASIYNQLDSADAVLIVGSSLMVFSSFRFCRKAWQNKIPIAAINKGKTRADELFEFKINENCEGPLRTLVEHLA